MHWRFALCAFALVVVAAPLGGQNVDSLRSPRPTRVVRGVVVSRRRPLAGADVFDLATLAGSATDSNGAFTIRLLDTLATRVRLSARHIGYKPADTTITSPTDSVVISLEPLAALASITVLAGRYTSSAVEHTTTLTPLEVMTTPGGGDVNSAVKTLPGVQTVDEGSGLFVRGGDYTETRTFIDGAPTFTAYQFQEPTGSVAGTINPFLTDAITFSSGGFGAEWGNALSGIVDLRSQARPQTTSASVNATLLSVGTGATARLPRGLGLSATAGASDLSLLYGVNGSPRRFRPPPRGNTVSAQGIWEYSTTGRLKLFALRQQSRMGIDVDDPAGTSTYRTRRVTDVVVGSLRDTVGRWRYFGDASTSGLGRGDSKGVYESRSSLRSWQAHGEAAFGWSERFIGSAGAETERIGASFDSRFPTNAYDPLAGAPFLGASLDRVGTRNALFAKIDTRPMSSAEVIVGVRTDRSNFATASTTDPRVSAAWVPFNLFTMTASWGIYHQLADPGFLDQPAPRGAFPAIGAEMSIAGVQVGDGAQFARVEVWRKTYRDLVALTRDYVAVGGLGGRASGADLFARGAGPLGARLRITWSAAWSRRSDPNTLLDAPAPWDVTHSVTAVAERDWANGWHVGVSERLATGRPFTDVKSAVLDSTSGVFVPTYGAPNADRLPGYRRVDIAVSRARSLSGGRFLVIFGAIQNPLNTVNLSGYTWTRDYTMRVPVRSTVTRTLFIGANLVRSRTS